VSQTANAFDNDVKIAWCPGCGNFAILDAVKKALARLDLPPEKVLICSGIGQAPKLPHYLQCNCFNGLHGREVASATAAKLVADDLTVLVHAGDGGAFGEGGNHFVSAIRRNVDITLVVHDNRTYGLTKGQASPTTEAGTKSKIQPEGLAIRPMNPLALAVSQDCSFVAQGTSAKDDHLAELLVEAIAHKGFSFVNVLQPCVTWDRVHTYAYYKERCYELDEGYDPTDPMGALRLVMTPSDKFPLGVLYRNQRPAYGDLVLAHRPRPLRDHPVEPDKAVRLFDRFK
jgi:2-oxoglutarate ferredoxin oxidoreductase subunit beta